MGRNYQIASYQSAKYNKKKANFDHILPAFLMLEGQEMLIPNIHNDWDKEGCEVDEEIEDDDDGEEEEEDDDDIEYNNACQRDGT